MINIINSPSLDSSLVYSIFFILSKRLQIDRKTTITVMFAYLNDPEDTERLKKGKTLGSISKLDSFSSIGEKKDGHLIQMDKSLDLEQVIRTAAHEMYHALQYQKDMDGINDIEEKSKPYRERRYEIEAKKYEKSIDVLDIMKECYEYRSYRLKSKIRTLENKV